MVGFCDRGNLIHPRGIKTKTMSYSGIIKKAESLGLSLVRLYHGKSRVYKENKGIVNLSVKEDGSWAFSNSTTQTATYRSGLGDAEKQRFLSGEIALVETVSYQDVTPARPMTNKEFYQAVMELDKYIKRETQDFAG